MHNTDVYNVITWCCVLKDHMKRHANNEMFLCPCGKVYLSKKALRNHQLHHHPIGDEFFEVIKAQRAEPKPPKPKTKRRRTYKPNTRTENLCAECGRTFSKPNALRLHALIHAGVKPYVCETCGHAFRVRAKLVMHERRHTGEKPFSCATCGRRFRLKEVLTRHLLVHTGEKPYICNVCGLNFRSRSQVINHHQARHVPYHERRRHQCDRCDKSYLSGRELKDHGARYHGDSFLICSVCGKQFPCSRALRVHMQVHVETTEHQCTHCRAWFKWRTSLKRHLVAIHGVKMPPMKASVPQSQGGNLKISDKPEVGQDSLGNNVTATPNGPAAWPNI